MSTEDERIKEHIERKRRVRGWPEGDKDLVAMAKELVLSDMLARLPLHWRTLFMDLIEYVEASEKWLEDFGDRGAGPGWDRWQAVREKLKLTEGGD